MIKKESRIKEWVYDKKKESMIKEGVRDKRRSLG